MKDKKVRDLYKLQNCVVCGIRGCDPCHIKTYATTLCDDPKNIIPMCRTHHEEQGKAGWFKMCRKYPSLALELEERGYYFNSWNKLCKDIE